MSYLRAYTLQKYLAPLCVAITLIFSVQTGVLLIDRIEHSLGIEHNETAVAGAVINCADIPGTCGPADGPDHQRVSHAHAGDHAGVKPTSLVAVPSIGFGPTIFAPLEHLALAGTGPHALERPPKA